MALLSELVKGIADAEGLDQTFVAGVARYLREAGLISQAGRGRGAAHMNSGDAANLIIGINAGSIAKDSAEVVNKFRELYIRPPLNRYSGDNVFGKITEGDARFGRALELVIDAHKVDSAGNQIWRSILTNDLLRFEIGFGRPTSAAFIRLSEMVPPSPTNPFSSLAWEANLIFAHFWNRKQLWSQGESRKELTLIGDKTLSSVGKILTT